MLNQYPLWKYLMLACVVLVSSIYALPNLYGEDPSVQVSHRSQPLIEEDRVAIEQTLKTKSIDFKRVELIENKVVLIDSNGEINFEYKKAKPVPGERVVRGDGKVPVHDTPFGRVAAVICFDMDFPTLIRQAGNAAADILLVPARDWKAIDPMHTRMLAIALAATIATAALNPGQADDLSFSDLPVPLRMR